MMARSWASASSRSSSSSYQFVGRDPLDDEEELVVLPSDSLSESNESDERRVTETSNVTEASDGGGNGRRATSLQDSHLAAASAEEDFAADWILGSSNDDFPSAPASAQPPPAPSALPSSPPEAAPQALPSGPESPHLAPTLGERSCGHGEREGMMHCAGTGGSISFAGESCSSAWSDGGNEGQQAEEFLAGSLLGSQEQQQQQQQQQQQGSPLGSEQQQQYSRSSSDQGYVVSSGGEGGGGGVQGLLASLATLEQERDALAVRVLDTDSALSASEGALRSLSAQHASTRTLLAELASHTLFSAAPPLLPAATAATAGATAAGAALPNEPQPPASPQQGPAPPGQASPSESLEGSGTAAAAQDGSAADTGSFPCPFLNAGAASAATAQDMVRDAVAGAESGDSEGPAVGALLLLALFGLAWLLGAAPPSAMHDLPTSPTAQRPHDPSPAAPAPAPSPPPVSSSPLTLQQPLQQTFLQQQQQQQQEEQCAAVPTDGHSCFPTIAECSSVACADAGAGVGAFLPCSAPGSGPGADVAEGSGPACTALASSSLVPSVTHGKGLSSALVQRLSGGLILQETHERRRAGTCSCSSTSTSSSKRSTSLALKLGGTQLMLWGSESVGSRSLVSQGAPGSVACRQELFGDRAFPGFHGFHSNDMNFDEGDDDGGERQQLGAGGWAALMSPAAPGKRRGGQEGGARSQERTAAGSGAGILSSSHHMGFEPSTYTALRSRSRFNDEERASNLAGMRSGGVGIPVPCQQWRMGSRNAKAALPSELTTALPAQQYHRAELGALTAVRLAHPSSGKVPSEHAAGAAHKAAQHTGVACSSTRAATYTTCKTAVAIEPRITCKALAVVPHSSGALALTPTPHHHNTFARAASSAPPTQSDIIALPHKTNPHATKLATIPENHQHAKSPAVGSSSSSSSSSRRGLPTMSSGTSALASSSGQPGPSSSSETAATLGGLSRAQARRSLGKRQHQQQQQQLLRLEKESKQNKRMKGWKESKQQAKKVKKASRKLQKGMHQRENLKRSRMAET